MSQIKKFGESQSLKQLTKLALKCNKISDKGARAFAESESLKQLAKLDLNYNRIGDGGARALAETITNERPPVTRSFCQMF
jgi:Leucine-rich repeat (LRR) protein